MTGLAYPTVTAARLEGRNPVSRLEFFLTNAAHGYKPHVYNPRGRNPVSRLEFFLTPPQPKLFVTPPELSQSSISPGVFFDGRSSPNARAMLKYCRNPVSRLEFFLTSPWSPPRLRSSLRRSQSSISPGVFFDGVTRTGSDGKSDSSRNPVSRLEFFLTTIPSMHAQKAMPVAIQYLAWSFF